MAARLALLLAPLVAVAALAIPAAGSAAPTTNTPLHTNFLTAVAGTGAPDALAGASSFEAMYYPRIGTLSFRFEYSPEITAPIRTVVLRLRSTGERLARLCRHCMLGRSEEDDLLLHASLRLPAGTVRALLAGSTFVEVRTSSGATIRGRVLPGREHRLAFTGPHAKPPQQLQLVTGICC
jgi:hypothetical protein